MPWFKQTGILPESTRGEGAIDTRLPRSAVVLRSPRLVDRLRPRHHDPRRPIFCSHEATADDVQDNRFLFRVVGFCDGGACRTGEREADSRSVPGGGQQGRRCQTRRGGLQVQEGCLREVSHPLGQGAKGGAEAGDDRRQVHPRPVDQFGAAAQCQYSSRPCNDHRGHHSREDHQRCVAVTRQEGSSAAGC